MCWERNTEEASITVMDHDGRKATVTLTAMKHLIEPIRLEIDWADSRYCGGYGDLFDALVSAENMVGKLPTLWRIKTERSKP